MQPTEIVKIGFAEIIEDTQRFLDKHWPAVTALCLTAATGSFLQEGGRGEISPEMKVFLEITVELSRALLLLLVLGNGNINRGLDRLGSVTRMKKNDWILVWHRLKTNVSWNIIALSINWVVFIIVGVVTNVVIELFVRIGLLEWLKTIGLVVGTASPWPLRLFLKNVSIIPFSLVFVCLLGLILVSKENRSEPKTSELK